MNYARAQGLRIAYDDHGSTGRGPAFLLVPGWCVNASFFAPLAERLAAHRRVLVLDWRGHGHSEKPAEDFGHAELLEDALAVIDAADVDSVIPIGQAHGAWLAIALSRRLGERVPALVALSFLLFDPPPPFRDVLDALQDPDRWEQARDQLFSMWTAGAPSEVGALARRDMGAYGYEMWARAARCIAGEYAGHGNPLRALTTLAPPPPFLHLFSQPRAPEFLAAQETLSRQHSWFQVRRLDAISHFLPLEAPDATAAEIERFAGSR